MGEKGVMIFVFSIFFIGFATAGYACSDNQTIQIESGIIDLGEVDRFEGLVLGLGMVRLYEPSEYLEIRLLTEGKSLKLTDSSTVETVLFRDDSEYNISLMNATKDSANISVNSNRVEIGLRETKSSGGILITFAKSIELSSGNFGVNLVLGKEEIAFLKYNERIKKVNHNGKEYILELETVLSERNVLANTYRCENESANIIEINDSLDDSNEQTEVIGDENPQTNNSEENNSTDNLEENATNGSLENHEINGTREESIEGGGSLFTSPMFYLLVVSILIFLFLLFRYRQNKKLEESAESSMNYSGTENR